MKKIKKHILPFISSIILIIIQFLVISDKYKKTSITKIVILLSTTIQILIQLIFFLDISYFLKKKWFSLAFLFSILISCIIIFMSIWIMDNLNANMLTN